MFAYLSEFEEYFGPLRLLRFITLRTLMAAGTAAFIGFVIGPWLIARLRVLKFGHDYVDDRVGELAAANFDKKQTPTMGGLLIFTSVFVSTVLWASLNIWVITALIVYVALTAVGFRDDYLKVVHKHRGGMSSVEKIFWQVAVATVVLAILLNHPASAVKMREFWAPFVKSPLIAVTPLWILAPFFFTVLVGSTNAINLTDGLDGLAIGCTITVALVYGIMAYAAGNVRIAEYLLISYVPGTGELAVICGALVGAGLAFLWYNCHPAELFMGDTGSLALGGLIGVIAFMVHQPLTLVIVGGIFVAEALSVIFQVGWFKITKRRTGTGLRLLRMSPVHHHFQLGGWPETKVVIRFWILSLVCALAGLGTLKLR
jgi:phospho-N-acetylmuramoyl-pentapeptide-transferase